jgi:hypothetical protein
METRKYSDFVSFFSRKNGIKEETAQLILQEYFDKSITKAINRKSHAIKKTFVVNCSIRDFQPEEKVTDYNIDKKTMKKLIIDIALPAKYKRYTFIPSHRHLTEFQNKIERKVVRYE